MKKKQLPKSIDFLSSHGLTVISLLFLMVITIIGTIDQKFVGLYQSQKIYFESLYFFPKAGGYVSFIPLPGGYTILAVLFVNLILAFVFKFRWRMRTAGVIICHIGLLLLLIGSYLTYAYSANGHMTFPEKEKRGYFTSYVDNQLILTEYEQDDKGNEVTKTSEYGNEYIRKDAQVVFPSKNLHVKIMYVFANSKPVANKSTQFSYQEYAQEPLALSLESEINTLGLYVAVFHGQTEVGRYYVYQTDVYDGLNTFFHFQGKKYGIHANRRKFPIPFSLKLLKFTRELYPGTNTPKHYESRVMLQEAGKDKKNHEREILISMNKPLRHKGYTFYQSSFVKKKQTMG